MKYLIRLAGLATLLPLLVASRCSSFEEAPGFSLPAVTQTGANTIGFVIDGQVWRDYGTSCSFSKPQCDSNQVRVNRYSGNNTSYTLQAGLTARGRNEQLIIDFNSLHRPGTYTSNTSTILNGLAALQVRFDRAEDSKLGSYVARRGTPFQVEVTKLDTVNRIIAGTFSGTLRGLFDTTKVVTMSDGRFDVRYRL